MNFQKGESLEKFKPKNNTAHNIVLAKCGV